MEEIQDYLNQLKEFDMPSLERAGKDFSFTDVYKQITEIFNNLTILQNSQEFWENLPEEKRSNIRSYLKQFLGYIRRIQSFDATQGNPQSERDNIAIQIKETYKLFYEHLFSGLKLYTLGKEFSSKKIQDLLNQANISVESISKQKEQGEEILKAMRETSAATGVSKFAAVFGEQAIQNEKSARNWLAVTIISASIIGIFLWWIFDQLVQILKSNVDFQISLQLFLAKILLLSFFSVVFYQIVKNYNANMHLYTLNKHRENSLKSFQSFVESTDNASIKDTVLIQATKAIFEAGDTGYLSSKSEGGITGIETIKIVEQLEKR